MSLVKKAKSHYLLLLIILYFVVRIINLTVLPIFNDEAIYLDWGWRETHTPGMLYYSMYDSKPPLLMWVFGIFETVFTDPLFAGRFVSVLVGLFTLSGIYIIAKTFFNKNIAFLSSLIYIVVPIFAFFDRQALMESAVAAVGVWACYLAMKLWITNKERYAYFLGLILGIGFCIKYSAILFILIYVLLSCIIWWKGKQKSQTAKQVGIVLVTIFTSTFLLIINPDFLNSLPRNAQYSLTLTELLHFPIMTWLKNAGDNLAISFFYITPFIFIAAIFGIAFVLKEKKKTYLLLIIWILLCLLIQTLVVRETSQRYLVSYLPLLVIPAAYMFHAVIERQKTIGLLILIGSLVVPFILSCLLLFSPSQYILIMAKTNPYSQMEYLTGATSGYGVSEVKDYLESVSENQDIFVGFAKNTGNPESSVVDYLHKNDYITTGTFDSRQFGDALNSVDCLSLLKKMYFISRNDEQAGMNKFLSKVKTFPNPYSNYSIGIYTVKEPCRGKSVQINVE
jgi:4-amino-4-deoxy-L-arabinose transferase-like glycosyltransferase